MTPSAPSHNGSDSLLADVVEEFTNRVQAGEPVDVESYVARHPEHAERLRQLLPALALLADLGRSVSAASDGTTARTDDTSLSGVLGDFRLLREVGKGGMGIVYEAEQISLRRRVALKVLPFAATMDPRHLQRFHNEAQAAACLHHTNIVPVYFVGCERGVHFYAMQFIDGQPLSEVIRQLTQAEKTGLTVAARTTASLTDNPTSWITERWHGRDYFRKVAELGVQAAEALDHAHQLGIVHRDVKPGNLLIDGRGNLWVTDFGLAQVQSDTRLTRTGDIVGTLRYMSPEQALAKRAVLDLRTDIYSLGATLYELLTLQPPFGGEDRQELLRQIAFEEPATPRRLHRSIPAELETIVLKAMEKNPTERYATAKDVADDLRRFLLNEPIRAKRANILQRIRKWTQRHKSAVEFAALVFALLVVGLAAGTYLLWQKEAETRDALEQVEKQRREALANEKRANALRRQAEQNLDKAFNDMNGLVLELENKELADISGIGRVREKLTTSVLRHLESYLDAESPDPEVRHWTARAYGSVALLQKDPRKRLDAFVKSVTIGEALTKEFPAEARYWRRLAYNRHGLAACLADQGRKSQAEEVYRQAMNAFEMAARVAPDDAHMLNNLAWQLAHSDDLAFRNPARAVVLARRAVELDPNYMAAWDTLGVVCYRVGNWSEAANALEKGLALFAEQGHRARPNLSRVSDHKDTAVTKFHLAMAYSRLGNAQKARSWYDQAAQWMDKNEPQNNELLRFRAEAADVLGIRQQLPDQETQTPPRKK